MNNQAQKTENNEFNDKYSFNVLMVKLFGLPAKTKLKILFNILFIIFCSSGLILQTLELFDEFRSGRTVVNIEYDSSKYVKIPAITVCYPWGVSLEGLAHKFPEFKPHFFNYTNILKNMTEEDLINDILTENLFSVYTGIVNAFNYNTNPDINQVFDVSIPYNVTKMNKTSISVIVEGTEMQMNKDKNFESILLTDEEPIESIVSGPDLNKCFTFFSNSNKKWRKYRIDITEIFITVVYSTDWFPFTRVDTPPLKISMHTPDEIPRHDSDNFIRLKPFCYHEFTYNRWKSEHLGSSFQSHCKNYNLDDSQPPNRMRSNCLKHCIHQKQSECIKTVKNSHKNSNESTSYEEFIYWTRKLWTKHDFPDHPKMGIRGPEHLGKYMNLTEIWHCLYHKQRAKFETECQLKCDIKCVNRYYNFDFKYTGEDVYYKTKATPIKILRNSIPDQITKHIPAMTFIQFASAFGGLISMWLGLSILAILKFSLHIF